MEELVKNTNGNPMTDTRMVAAAFGKRHNNVMRDFESIITKLNGKLDPLTYEHGSYLDVNQQLRPMYQLDETAFTMLVMSYNTPKALDIKLTYINAFHEMRKQLVAVQQSNLKVELDLNTLQQLIDDSKEKQRLLVSHATLSKQITKAQPKADIFDDVMGSEGLIRIGDLAKSSNRLQRYGIGRNKLYNILRNNGVLDKHNTPYQKYMKHFSVVMGETNGHQWVTTYLTPKGACWLVNIVVKAHTKA